MPRPKIAEEEQLKHLLRIRANQIVYHRLTALQKQSDCRSICEIGRKILSKERINLFQKDASMNGPMEELALIRKEIKAICININQQTHYYIDNKAVVGTCYQTLWRLIVPRGSLVSYLYYLSTL